MAGASVVASIYGRYVCQSHPSPSTQYVLWTQARASLCEIVCISVPFSLSVLLWIVDDDTVAIGAQFPSCWKHWVLPEM